MNDDTKLAIDLITGLPTTSVIARTHVFSPSMMRAMFFYEFVGKNKDIAPNKQLKALGVTMKEVNWAEVFEVIVVENITVTSIFNINEMSGTKEFFEVTIKMNNDLTK